MESIQVSKNNIWLSDKFAEIQEIKKLGHENDNGLRIFINQIGINKNHYLTLQIRTFKGIGELGKGKKRNMMANINVTVEELETILKVVKSYDDPNSEMSHKG